MAVKTSINKKAKYSNVFRWILKEKCKNVERSFNVPFGENNYVSGVCVYIYILYVTSSMVFPVCLETTKY